MPESYIEPLTDRQQCFTCHKTVTGKKKLFKCAGCHAITYCGVECQKEDRTRHQWNCVPVMVTEIPGKGRGLVAARNIKMGELIFTDKPVIKVNSDEDTDEIMNSLARQIDKLSIEAKRQFNQLNVSPKYEDGIELNVNLLNFSKFVSNCAKSWRGMNDCWFLQLNTILINHSCAPNAAKGPLLPDEDYKNEVRAIKDITRGDEITLCYLGGLEHYLTCGFDKLRRMREIRDLFGFDCKCCVCSGSVPGQEEIIMELLTVLGTTDGNRSTSSDWKAIAKTFKIAEELTRKLYTGCVVLLKLTALNDLAGAAHLARDEDLLMKALDNYNQLVEDTKLEYVRLAYERMKEDLSRWTVQLKSKKRPRQEEIDFFSPQRRKWVNF